MTTTPSTGSSDDAIVARGAPRAKPDVSSAAYSIKWLFSGTSAPGAAQTLGYVVIEPGGKNPLHAHPNCEEVLYLIAGELDHSLDGAMYRLKAGDAIRVPAGARHDARCTSAEPATMVVCYSVPDRQIVNYD
jgi:quercetin dioxygenase-like cupin family protein